MNLKEAINDAYHFVRRASDPLFLRDRSSVRTCDDGCCIRIGNDWTIVPFTGEKAVGPEGIKTLLGVVMKPAIKWQVTWDESSGNSARSDQARRFNTCNDGHSPEFADIKEALLAIHRQMALSILDDIDWSIERDERDERDKHAVRLDSKRRKNASGA